MSHSCAQHYMGDIGLLGVKKGGLECYHVFVGGGFGNRAAIGRQILQAVPFEGLKPAVQNILNALLETSLPGESFQRFTARHEVDDLQRLSSNL